MNSVICLVYVPVGENAFLFNFFYITIQEWKKKVSIIRYCIGQKVTKVDKLF